MVRSVAGHKKFLEFHTYSLRNSPAKSRAVLAEKSTSACKQALEGLGVFYWGVHCVIIQYFGMHEFSPAISLMVAFLSFAVKSFLSLSVGAANAEVLESKAAIPSFRKFCKPSSSAIRPSSGEEENLDSPAK